MDTKQGLTQRSLQIHWNGQINFMSLILVVIVVFLLNFAKQCGDQNLLAALHSAIRDLCTVESRAEKPWTAL